MFFLSLLLSSSTTSHSVTFSHFTLTFNGNTPAAPLERSVAGEIRDESDGKERKEERKCDEAGKNFIITYIHSSDKREKNRYVIVKSVIITIIIINI